MADTKAPLNFEGITEPGTEPIVDQSGAEYDFSGLEDIGPDTVEPIEPSESSVGNAEDDAILKQAADEYMKYADRPVEAAITSALGTASWSLSDRMLKKLGIRTEEDLKKLREYNTGADTVGMIAGTVAPMFVSGPLATGGTATRTAGTALNAASKFGRAGEKIVEGALSGVKNKVLAREIVKKSIASGAGSAVEGAAFGLQQLAREEALGEADFNADNLMGAVGTGALYGGLLGAATPSMAAAAKGLARGTSSLIEKGAAKTLNRVENAAELVGETASQKAKALTDTLRNQEREALPDFIVNAVASGKDISSPSKMLGVFETVRAETRDALKAFYKKVDDAAAASGKQSPFAWDTISAKLGETIDEFVTPLEGKQASRGLLRKFKAEVSDFSDWIKANPHPTAEQIWAQRKYFDEKINYKNVAQDKGERRFYGKLRRDLDQHVKSYAESVSPGLAKELEDLNLKFRVAERYIPSLAKKAAKSSEAFKYTDVPYALVAGGFQSPLAMGILGAKKVLESDFKRRLVVLSTIEKSNKAVMSQMKSAIENFAGAAARPAKSLSTRALVQSQLSFDHSKKDGAPKDKQQAFENVQKNLIEFKTHPERLAERATKTSALVSGGAPKTAEFLGQRMIGAVEFLYDKMPKNPYDVEVPGISGRQYKPSAAELSKFERYVQVVESPISVFNEMEAGTLTRDHVEALEAVYPAFYKKLQQEVHAKVSELDAKGEHSLPYKKRVQLGILFGQPTDSSMTGRAIVDLQATFQPAQDQRNMQAAQAKGLVAPSQEGLSKLNMAGREATGTQKVAMGGTEV